MKNQETKIEINAVGNMSLSQQMSHARRSGADSFISTDGRMYLLKKGKWELQPQPKQDRAHFSGLLELAKLVGPEYVNSVIAVAKSHGYNL